ncbi:MarR family winged helix-turn-helix transcriptional regulator [Consotaella aegiceratis]|uniref:MarR family winged helix-turn-helix transcriptional regulator n=1 Tax=Consotaella aegiceratis TaxID=3097961 RepID=UPI002F426868
MRPKKAEFEPLERAVHQIIQMIVSRDRELAGRYGLALTDLTCLHYLQTCETAGVLVSAKMISEYVGLSTGATTALIDRLEHQCYVERRPNPTDRRSVTIHLIEAKADEVLEENRFLHLALKETWEEASAEEAEAVTRFLSETLAKAKRQQ